MLLGIDIGTTKVAAVIVDAGGGVMASASRLHGADLPATMGRSEQDVGVIFKAVRTVVCDLPADLRGKVQAVGVTGQMHGVVVLDPQGGALTPLITWQDGRCLEDDFLRRLNAQVGRELRTGYGCATLAWLVAHGQMPAEAAGSCTVHDLLVAALCGASKPVTDPTDAASWGLFDLQRLDWDSLAVKAAGIPGFILPKVVPCGAEAGKVHSRAAEELGIPGGIPVASAIGDNQASLLATLKDPARELALTLGTGGQVSAVVSIGGQASRQVGLPYGPVWAPHDGSPVRARTSLLTYEYRPYPGGRMLVVAASLCGGAAWAWLADTVISWQSDLGFPPMSRDEVFGRLNDLALRTGQNSGQSIAKPQAELRVAPHFLGERYDASLRASISGIDLRNFDLGGLARALARGIIRNLKDMLPPQVLEGRQRIVGSGNALRRNAVLRQMVVEVFCLPLEMAEGLEEAATGAALNAAGLLE